MRVALPYESGVTLWEWLYPMGMALSYGSGFTLESGVTL